MKHIGQLKGKVNVRCSICGCGYRRTVVVSVCENTTESIDKAKAELTVKGNKKYTCRICKNIEKDVNNS